MMKLIMKSKMKSLIISTISTIISGYNTKIQRTPTKNISVYFFVFFFLYFFLLFFFFCVFLWWGLLWLEFGIVSCMVYSVFSTVGEIDLLYDVVHDEVFIDGSGLVLMANGRWLFDDDELMLIFNYLKKME